MDMYASLTSPQGGFSLRYINVFFTPAFVLLPLSPPVSGIEVGKIIAVFLLGFFVMLATTAYLVRGLQLFLGTSKRATTERAEEMGGENDNIQLTDPNRTWSMVSEEPHTNGSIVLPTFPSPTQDASYPRTFNNSTPPLVDTQNVVPTTILRQNPRPLTRPQRWAAWVNLRLDILTYAILFLFAGIPVLIATGYAMPIHLSFSVLAYQAALAFPPNWRRFLHPVLVSSAFTIIGIWILALCRHEGLQDGLHAYSTKTKYLQIWSGNQKLPLPGAGDILSSVLDVSIVALALPMFQYRNELQRHFFAIVLPNIAISIASIFGYPALCYAIGIESKHSLSFAARSLTLALAIPATANLGGDLNLVAVLCIMSGILGVLMGPAILKWLRIPEDDYVTRGVTLGGNSSAIATALLLVSDPRAAALSSLSMGLFGTVMVALTSVPPIVRVVLALVGQ